MWKSVHPPKTQRLPDLYASLSPKPETSPHREKGMMHIKSPEAQCPSVFVLRKLFEQWSSCSEKNTPDQAEDQMKELMIETLSSLKSQQLFSKQKGRINKEAFDQSMKDVEIE
ncbi:hypothetical protein TNCV_4394061 [Trichonephila clavipes]|uniref:Uncharacterized protein n=1 Tax=Trichonephila clavipes TaxID=2585209 RepID=A0A8X6W4D4_TRICX|nr:hypothetical protein TNCV_4394061 [Trichonephila clavipes]